MTAEILDYKNKKILRIKKDNSFVKIQFGVVKAKMILDALPDIQLFVRDNTPDKEDEKVSIVSSFAAPTHIIEPGLAGEVSI